MGTMQCFTLHYKSERERYSICLIIPQEPEHGMWPKLSQSDIGVWDPDFGARHPGQKSELGTVMSMKVLVTQSCPTLCDPMDCSPLDVSVHGILQARILDWAAFPFFRGSSWPRDRTSVSCLACGLLTTGPPGKPMMTVTRFSIGASGLEQWWFLCRGTSLITASLGLQLPYSLAFLKILPHLILF